MKLFGKIVLLGAGAALGYYLANNKVDLELNVEPIVDKVKTKLNEVMSKKPDDEDERCDCGCGCGCEDAEEVVEEAADAVEDMMGGMAD